MCLLYRSHAQCIVSRVHTLLWEKGASINIVVIFLSILTPFPFVDAVAKSGLFSKMVIWLTANITSSLSTIPVVYGWPELFDLICNEQSLPRHHTVWWKRFKLPHPSQWYCMTKSLCSRDWTLLSKSAWPPHDATRVTSVLVEIVPPQILYVKIVNFFLFR